MACSRLDYFPLKGDASELMQFMVEHPDMVTLSQREIDAKKHTMREIFESSYLACTTPTTTATYSPDVLIANPPCSSAVTLAEYLHIPLQVSGEVRAKMRRSMKPMSQ